MAATAGPNLVNESRDHLAPHPVDFIRDRLQLTPVPGRPDIRLYVGRPDSGLGRFTAEHNGGRAPYWAYPWSGGMALALYIQQYPQAVRDRRVLDLGAGGGIVSIAAMRAGAAHVTAAETDPVGAVALRLNTGANDVTLTIVTSDLLPGPPPPDIDLVVTGDLFYAPDLAERTTSFLERCRTAGLTVLIGDPGRADLPLGRLTELAHYEVPEVGAPRNAATTTAAVYAFD